MIYFKTLSVEFLTTFSSICSECRKVDHTGKDIPARYKTSLLHCTSFRPLPMISFNRLCIFHIPRLSENGLQLFIVNLDFYKMSSTPREKQREIQTTEFVPLFWTRCLSVDNVHWNASDHRHDGFVDFGGGLVSGEVASQALVFMLVGLKGRWKAPIAFFFTSHVTGDQLANLIKLAISKAADSDLLVKAVTADGLSANLKAAKLLGCEIRAENPKPFFKHPHPKFKAENVFYICDAAHMLKLMRNLLAHVTNSVLLPQDEAIY